MTDPFTHPAVLGDDVLVQPVSEEAVLLDLASGVYFGLNPSGARFWTLLGELGTGEAAVRAMIAEFEVSAETLRTDMRRLLQDLLERGLVTLGPGGADSNGA